MTTGITTLKPLWTQAAAPPAPRPDAEAPDAAADAARPLQQPEDTLETPARPLDAYDPNTIADQATLLALEHLAHDGLIDPPGNQPTSGTTKEGAKKDPVLALLEDERFTAILTPEQWDKVAVRIGDTWTTQGEVLAARKHYLANFDEYYERAVREGKVNAKEKEAVRRWLEAQIRADEYARVHGSQRSEALDKEVMRLETGVPRETREATQQQYIQVLREENKIHSEAAHQFPGSPPDHNTEISPDEKGKKSPKDVKPSDDFNGVAAFDAGNDTQLADVGPEKPSPPFTRQPFGGDNAPPKLT